MMIPAIFSLCAALIGAPAPVGPAALAAPADTGDTIAIVVLSTPIPLPQVAVDSPHTRPKIVEVSDWYNRRFTIHRWLSYTIIPLFAIQYDAGLRLYKHPIDAPDWVLPTHRATAAAIGAVFLVNTVTGVWNLWDSRDVPDHRTLRLVHGISMLVADAGFTYAGAVLSRQARDDLGKRKLHKEIAISSISLSLVSGVAMKILNR